MAFDLIPLPYDKDALAPAISTQMSLDPLVSVMLGVLIFEERIDDTFIEGSIAAIGLAVMIFGLVILARSQAHNEVVAKPAPKAEPAPAA